MPPKRERYFESLDVTLTPRAIETLEPAVRALADDEFDEHTRLELTQLANDLWSRLERCKAGDLQKG